MRKMLEVEISPEELAKAFCEFGDTKQAAFFAAIKPITDEWAALGCARNRTGFAEN